MLDGAKGADECGRRCLQRLRARESSDRRGVGNAEGLAAIVGRATGTVQVVGCDDERVLVGGRASPKSSVE